MTTISEIVLIVCLVRKQLFEYVVSVGRKAAEEIVVVVVFKLQITVANKYCITATCIKYSVRDLICYVSYHSYRPCVQ